MSVAAVLEIYTFPGKHHFLIKEMALVSEFQYRACARFYNPIERTNFRADDKHCQQAASYIIEQWIKRACVSRLFIKGEKNFELFKEFQPGNIQEVYLIKKNKKEKKTKEVSSIVSAQNTLCQEIIQRKLPFASGETTVASLISLKKQKQRSRKLSCWN